jgi:hypothetical protein
MGMRLGVSLVGVSQVDESVPEFLIWIIDILRKITSCNH